MVVGGLGLRARRSPSASIGSAGRRRVSPAHQSRAPLTPTVGAHAATSSAAVVPHLTYYGGRVLSSVQVIEILYGQGAYEPEVSRSSAPSIASLYTGHHELLVLRHAVAVQHHHHGRCGKPGHQPVDRPGTFVNQVTITPSPVNDGATIDDSNISAELVAQVNAGNLPAENGNILYALYFPAGKTITAGPWRDLRCAVLRVPRHHAGRRSCTTAYCRTSRRPVWPGTAAPAANSRTCLRCRRMNSPKRSPIRRWAWRRRTRRLWPGTTSNPSDPNQGEVGEIGDICNGQATTTLGGDGATYTVQKIWSNAQTACTSSPPGSPSRFALAAAPGLGRSVAGVRCRVHPSPRPSRRGPRARSRSRRRARRWGSAVDLQSHLGHRGIELDADLRGRARARRREPIPSPSPVSRVRPATTASLSLTITSSASVGPRVPALWRSMTAALG